MLLYIIHSKVPTYWPSMSALCQSQPSTSKQVTWMNYCNYYNLLRINQVTVWNQHQSLSLFDTVAATLGEFSRSLEVLRPQFTLISDYNHKHAFIYWNKAWYPYTVSWELHSGGKTLIICLKMTFYEITHKTFYVSWGVICEGLDVQMTLRRPAG